MTLTYEKVAQAAEKIQAAGQKVTQAAVRKALGGGSFTTINPLLQQWRDAGAETAALAEIEVPESLETSAQQFVAAIWRDAVRRADAGQAGLRARISELEEKLASLEAEHAEALQMVENDLETAQQRLQNEEASRKGAEERTRAMELEVVRLREAEKRLEVTEARADRAEARADRAEARADQAAKLSVAGP